MSFSLEQILAMEEAGLTREQVFSLLKADARTDQERRASRRSGATERKRRQRARAATDPVTPVTRDTPSAPPDGPPPPPAPPPPPLNPPDHPRSEPSGSGTGGPAPERKVVFSEGRRTLVGLGLDRKTSGDVIARWLRDTEDDALVLGAIRSAGVQAVLAPIPWITARLNPRMSHGPATGLTDLDQALAASVERLRAVVQPPNRYPRDCA